MTTAFRPTMTDLITEVRRLIGDSKPADTQSVTRWSDTDLQEALDDHRLEVVRESLRQEPTWTGSDVQYLIYRSAYEQFERTDGGTALFIVEDANGTNKGTATYGVDYRRGVVTFTADQGGTAYYLTGRSYDLYGAAAAVLDWWVAAEPVDYLTDSDGRRYFDRTRARARGDLAATHRHRARPVAMAMIRGDV